MSKLPSQKLLKKSECRDLKGEEVKHFNFAGWYHAGIHGVGSSSGKGIHDAGVFRRGAGAGIATAISFVPFRSEIAYNAEIKRPREPPGRHVSPRDHEGEDDRGKYGNLPTPWHRNSISARCILRDTLNDTRPRYFHRGEIRWTRCTRFIPPWMMALLIGGLLDRVKETLEIWGLGYFYLFLFFSEWQETTPPSKE